MSSLACTIAQKIKQKRKELGLTQAELGLILGRSVQLIQHYEKGTCQMPLETLNDLAQLCKLPLDWFFVGDQEILVEFHPLNEG